MNPSLFGKILRQIRQQQGWTQEQMARSLGISRQALFLLETGRGFPSVPLAFRIARLCNRSLDDLFNIATPDQKDRQHSHNFHAPDLDRLHTELDRMFQSRSQPGSPHRQSNNSVPAVNVRQTEKDVIVEATLPGLTAKEVQINITEHSVSLRGERKDEKEVSDGNFIRKEYSYGNFSREITLPTAVKAEEAEANLKNGLLTIRLPKKETTFSGRELKINEE